MRYHVIYLLTGEREAAEVEAQDAAAAVAAVTQLKDHKLSAFELLSVVPAEEGAIPLGR